MSTFTRATADEKPGTILNFLEPETLVLFREDFREKNNKRICDYQRDQREII